MRIARLDTSDGARDAIWTDDAWAVVQDGFAAHQFPTGVTVAADAARLLAPCEPQVLLVIALSRAVSRRRAPLFLPAPSR